MKQAVAKDWDALTPGEKWLAFRSWTQAVQLEVFPRMSLQDRLMIFRRLGDAPEACGPDIRGSLGQGKLVAFMPRALAISATGEARVVEGGYLGRAAARVADAFDRMEMRRPRADRRKPLFDAVQVNAARDYAALFERVHAGAVKGSSLEARTDGGGGDPDGFLQRRLDARDALEATQRRIGDKVALQVRRLRPSARGSRRSISNRELVDGVCLAGRTIDEVLERAGWKKDCRVRNVLRSALAASLDRMSKRY